MGHPTEGSLQAYLDGETDGLEKESVRAHLSRCEPCRSMAEAQEEASAQVSRALLPLDREPSLPLEEARRLLYARRGSPGGVQSVRERAVGGRARHSSLNGIPLPLPGGRRILPLPWAASIALLLTAGAVSALPGSPVREWLVRGWEAVAGSGSRPAGAESGVPVDPETVTAPEPGTPAEIGASIPAGDEGVELWITGLPAGADLRVVWVDGNMAGIFAGEGTRFRTEPGRLDAEAPPGAVRVEIPRDLGRVVVGVDGRVLVRVSGDDVDILGPIQRRTPMEVLLRPGGP
jgi:anti-sigma factor RsiW